ncbi:glycerol kinase GlpK [uncultured Brevundimonas sp.]|uniref:glycerol kinase GlpK n=1 Tax=uncultured Brevundimonas sp. TaxID=213418 RepID=UPI0026357D1B|nr:glycerol kinase GlpK [uncultured Brevundimonas sp.]
MKRDLILSIDQGTTSTRAIAFEVSPEGVFSVLALSQIELAQHFPHSGWVEHDADEIWRATLQTCREVIRKAGSVERFAAVGITNQRETSVIWDAATGQPLHRAIVWQDRRTAERMDELIAAGHEVEVRRQTGLILDPYFSASKYAWLLDQVENGRARARAGEIKLGTIDSWLMWKLTDGASHVTDVTNAARTNLMALETREWSPSLCELFDVPIEALPEIRPSDSHFGDCAPALLGKALPIHGVAGDQQSALVGHGALEAGDAKITYGTGAFLVANTGEAIVRSDARLLGTMGWAAGGRVHYALEGSIFSAGSAVQWLRDGLKAITDSRQSEAVAQTLKDNGGVYLVPGFTGLGAPWWEPDARGTVIGLSRDSGPAHLVRAALESLAYQTYDLLEALRKDGAPPMKRLKVDGGVTANAFVMQFIADICDIEVERPAFQEMTALGAARLAAFGCGMTETLWSPPQTAPAIWKPDMDSDQRARLIKGWRRAVRAAIVAATDEE